MCTCGWSQFISVGFTPSIEWELDPWVLELVQTFRTLGFDGAIDVPSGSVQFAAMSFVAVTYAVLTVQEAVEEHLFMQDEGSWQSMWLICDAFTRAVSTVLFMPVRDIPDSLPYE